jgi:hypothetical protein
VRPVVTPRKTGLDTTDERRLSIFERKNPSQNIGLTCERRQWRKRYNRELGDLYNEPNTVTVTKSGTLRWTANVVRMDENELRLKILWTNPGGKRGHGRLKSRWIDGVEEEARKMGCRNWLAAA